MPSKSWQIKYAEVILSNVQKGDELFEQIVDNHGKLQMILCIDTMVFVGKLLGPALDQTLISGFCKNWSTKCLVRDREHLAKTLLLAFAITVSLNDMHPQERASQLECCISSSIRDYSQRYIGSLIQRCLKIPAGQLSLYS